MGFALQYSLPRQLAVPYVDFAQAVMSMHPVKIQAELKKHQGLFARQQNLGLVYQAMDRVLARRLLACHSTYSRLSLDQLSRDPSLVYISEAELTPLVSVENLVLQMIQARTLNASISHRDGGIVTFIESSSIKDTQIIQSLESLSAQSQAFAQTFDAWSRTVSLSDDYYAQKRSSTSATPVQDASHLGLHLDEFE